MRTLASWQRTAMSCVVFGVGLSKALGGNMAVGVIFSLLGVLYGLSAFINNQVQLRTYMSHNSYRINSRLILATSFFTLFGYAMLLAQMETLNGYSANSYDGAAAIP